MDDSSRRGTDLTNENVHNFVVNILAKGGLLHFSLFLSMYLSLIFYWYKKNKNQLDSEEKKIVLKKITSIEFTSYKFEKNIFKTLKFFIKNKKYLTSFKNIVVLICPRFILKKYMLFA